jgi:hypothetical protein
MGDAYRRITIERALGRDRSARHGVPGARWARGRAPPHPATPCKPSHITTVVNAFSVTPPEFYEPPSVTIHNSKIRALYATTQQRNLKRMRETINQSSTFVAFQRRELPNLQVLPSVNGFNHTEVIEALLASGVRFHSLSSGGKKWVTTRLTQCTHLVCIQCSVHADGAALVCRWGKLATFLTKFRALQYQVHRQLPFMLQLEEDVRPLPAWNAMVKFACERYDDEPNVTMVQLSPYSELVLTSLAGAHRLMELVRRYGIMRNDDQQARPPPERATLALNP